VVTDDADTATLFADAAAAAGATPEQWASLEWRLDNLYWIVDKQAQTVRFRMNDEQRDFVQRLWYRNLILKARQKGFSTLLQIIHLDQAWWNPNHNGVVIADTLPNASKLFGKIEYAYARLPDALQEAYPVVKREVGTLLSIGHTDDAGKPANSTISVTVSSRGGTVQLLHVSELGKIGLKFPQRAEEINTGAIPSVPPDGVVVIESTAEGAFGLFWDLCEPAIKRWHEGARETRLDWRLHFYAWFTSAEYRLPDDEVPLVEIPPKLAAYFRQKEVELGITLDANQRAWYAKEKERLKSKMKQEYPSTPEEAFEQAIEGAIFGEQMTWLREHGRLGVLDIDINYPVDTVWDFGTGATNAIWFKQTIGVQHRWFYFISGAMVEGMKGLRYWWQDVCEVHRVAHGYQWGKHILPHDAEAEILGEVPTTKRRILEGLGMGSGDGGSIVVVSRIATIDQGIEITRKALGGNHWFDKRVPDTTKGEDMGAGHGIKCLDGYQYEWNDKAGVWSRIPLHNWASHGADAWRQWAQAPADSITNHNSSALMRFKQRPRRGY
jgi:hypothetical protein